MSLLNLGIVAHVDAGKTSLTERLLYEAGAVSRPGSVDAGTTRTDSMELERRRGITIRAAVTSIAIGDLTINLLDTPGHPDFIAEVERSLSVLDAAVLVVSGVEGVQPQTVAIWRALRRIGVPTVFFLNKMDRRGADVGRVMTQIRRRLAAHPVMLTTVTGQGGRDARVRAVGLDAEAVVEAVAEVDDAVAARWLTGEPARARDVRRAIRHAVRRAALTPVACGSAITGAGVRQLCRLLAELLPRGEERDGPLAGTVFAVDRDCHGRRAWLRLWSGQLRVRDRVQLAGARPQTVTQIAVTEPAGVLVRPSASAGQIAAVRGLSARVGQHVGDPPRRHAYRFPPATRQALVEPVEPAQRLAMFAGLTELADEDPLVDLRLDERQEQAVVRLHGEVQKEVLAALLEDRYGVRVRFSGTLTACIERVAGTGAAEDSVSLRGNPYLAGVGLRIDAAPVGHGIEFRPGIEPGRLRRCGDRRAGTDPLGLRDDVPENSWGIGALHGRDRLPRAAEVGDGDDVGKAVAAGVRRPVRAAQPEELAASGQPQRLVATGGRAADHERVMTAHETARPFEDDSDRRADRGRGGPGRCGRCECRDRGRRDECRDDVAFHGAPPFGVAVDASTFENITSGPADTGVSVTIGYAYAM